MKEKIYIIVTAAKNEEAYIEKVMESVVKQSKLPKKWVIISDGSTDRTDEIVNRYAAKYDFIEFLKKVPDKDRNFGSKAKAISIGYERAKTTDHDYVGILDADVSFGSSYYENVIDKFGQNPKLGVGGGILYDFHKNQFIKQNLSIDWSVSGPIQMFRKKCFEDIGGYKQVRGGVDAVAEIMARMFGWEVKTFPEIHVLHHRATGRERRGLWAAAFRQGLEDFSLGYHPIFFLFKCMNRLLQKPYRMVSSAMLLGYFWAWISRKKLQVPRQFVKYLRHEQMGRLKTRLMFKSIINDV